ncbi:MAG: metalloregulator ArsR/SmtB family transcription factor [Paracoccaceae bacterium]
MSISPKKALLQEYALVAGALASPARLALLEQLAQGPQRVEALAGKTGLSVANCSQHLQQLRRAALVSGHRDGKAVIYSLTDSTTLKLMALLATVADRNLAQVDRILRGLSGGGDLPEPISRADLAARLAKGSVILLDVRPADEFAAGHIPGARNVAPGDIARIAPTLARDGEIVAYCRGPYCVYAHEAVAALRVLGFNARRLHGGLPDWRADGRAVQTAA